jgi:iron complex outermembrane recepter protein
VSFRPDRLRNYEIGAKFRLFDRRLQINTAAFYDIWTGIQTDQYFTSGLAYTANVGDGRDVGLEVETVWRPNEAWTIQGNTLFANPKVTRVDPAFASKTQSKLPGVPDFSFGSLVAYRRPIGEGKSLRLAAELGYIGRSRLTFDSAMSPKMGGYVTAGLSAQLDFPAWRINAHLENVANTKGDTFAYGNPFSFGQVRQATPQRPRTLSLEVSRIF